MRNLKLTVLIEPGVKGELMNVLGKDFITLGNKFKFMQYTFPSIKMLTAFKLRPIVQLINTFESAHFPLSFYMLHLDDETSHSPVYFQCSKGMWSIVNSKCGVEVQQSNDLFSLI